MKTTSVAKPLKRPTRTCTRCLEKTTNWYPTTGGARLPLVRCERCYIEELSRYDRECLDYEVARRIENKETKLKPKRVKK
jgi:hypothetical protein